MTFKDFFICIGKALPNWVIYFLPIYIFVCLIIAIMQYRKLIKYFPVSSKHILKNIDVNISTNNKEIDSNLSPILKEKNEPLINPNNKINNNDLTKNNTSNTIINNVEDTLIENQNNIVLDDNKKKLEAIDKSIDEFYPEFIRLDKPRFLFLRLLYGTLFLVLFRFLILIVFLIIGSIVGTIVNCLFDFRTNKKECRQSKFRRLLLKIQVYLTVFPIQLALGLFTFQTVKDDEKTIKIYEKYFGPNYFVDIDDKETFGNSSCNNCIIKVNGVVSKEKLLKLKRSSIKSKRNHYSIYISNHHGWVECLQYLVKNTPGFIAKYELATIPLMGSLLYNLDCLLVNRENKENRTIIKDNIIKRQKLFYEGKTLAPLLIFPEGTVTNGTYIINFKKGAFYSKLPIKPLYSNVDTNSHGIYLTPLSFFDHMYYMFCYTWTCCIFYELPVIECNQYMIDNFKKEDETEIDTYCRVANLIYQELFNLKYSEKSFHDQLKYENCVELRR